MKFFNIFFFEIGYQIRRPSTWIYFTVMTALIFLVISEIADYASSVERVLLNAPLVIADITGYANKFGLIVLAALAVDGALRDSQIRMDSLVYTTPVTKFSYLGGRFLGIFFCACILLISAVPLAFTVFRLTSSLDSSILGDFRFLPFSKAAIFLTIPNVFVATAIMYALVLLTRSTIMAYLIAAILFVLSTFTLEFFEGNWTLAKLLDPSGATILNLLQWSLTPLQFNVEEVRFNGFLLANRCLWSGIALITGVIGFSRFKLAYHVGESRLKKELHEPNVTSERSIYIKPLLRKRMFGLRTLIYQTSNLAFTYYSELVRSPFILTLAGMAVYAFLLLPNLMLGPIDVPMLPVTDMVATYLGHSTLQIFAVMLITLFAGQLIWRERDARIHEISDATPMLDSIVVVSKYLTLTLLICTLQIMLTVAGVLAQISNGYYQINISTYLYMVLGVQLIEYLMLAAVAMSVHIIVNQKYVSHFFVMLFYLYTLVAPRLGIEHKLLIFGSDVGFAPTFFYAQRPFILPWIIFKLYWLGWTIIILVIGKHLVVRGTEISFRTRFVKTFNGIRHSFILLCSVILIAVTGGFIFYHTNILNEYRTRRDRIDLQIEYEKMYGRFRNSPQPELVAISLQVEFFPARQEARILGTYLLKNNTEQMLDSVHVDMSERVKTSDLTFSRKAKAVVTDNKLRHFIYFLESPLRPGDSLQLGFTLHYSPVGFSNDGFQTRIMDNGSYISNNEWLPLIGYQTDRELDKKQIRSEHGLPERAVLALPNDTVALHDHTGIERIAFEVTIGTSSDQTGVAPGTLRKKWMENGRAYFHYVADAPIQNMYHIYSSRYETRKANWNGVDIELLYNPENTVNLDDFEKSILASLDYYTRNFSPYPFHQLKFVEYADTGNGGISLPGTIGYSTNFSWLNPVADNRGFNLPFAVAAHEIAHQWWGHQLVPANVQGRAFLSESLAWYSALNVVDSVYGSDHLQHLLDAMHADFLRPRSKASVPLIQADDPFLAYRKGPLAMYTLREYAGAKNINRALKNLLKRFQPGEFPRPTSLDFYQEIKTVTPDSLHYLLRDLFETNTFWELETKNAILQPAPHGQWRVILDVLAKKIRVDVNGLETEVPMDDYIEIGMFRNSATSSEMNLIKRRIHSGANRITIELSQKPDQAAADPRSLLIDADPANNWIKIIPVTHR